ncbi:MAG: hypothetical protein AB7P03_12530 [Kofleriaceae bacterium]
MSRALGVIAAVLALAGCAPKDNDPTGIGKWQFGKFTLAKVDYTPFCQKTDLSDGRKGTWCFQQPPFKIGDRTAEVSLYFLGTEQTAPLIEIQFEVRGCVESELDAWLRNAFGGPISTRPNRGYWQNKHVWVAALMPAEPAKCRVHMIPRAETTEIERIKLL